MFGGLIAGPLAAWLATRSSSGVLRQSLYAADTPVAAGNVSLLSSDRWLLPILAILAALALGPWLGALIGKSGLSLPAFLTVMLCGVLITNLADLMRRPLDTDVADLIGTVALRIFLAMALMSLDWAALVGSLPLILTASVLQVLTVAAIAVLVVYPLLGRDRDAAAAAGGFTGFALGAMPVGLAVMRRFNQHFGDTPRGLLVFTLAASLYTDTANALFLALLFPELR